MTANKFKRTKYTCFYTFIASASAFSLPPMLFVTFREMYGISYTLLGTLVLINFCTQLSIDLIFSFFTKYFNIHKTIRTMPFLTALGLLIYAVTPMIAPDHAYSGLVIGTIVFSVAAGLGEVLLSPLVAAIPSETPERDMSLLHSLYAWGVLIVVLISSVYFKLFGNFNWMYLAIFFAILPVISGVLFCISPMPEMNISHSPSNAAERQGKGILLCAACIFLGSCAENTMTNWISGYMENALKVPKAMGDILGMAAFAVLLGVGRTWYAKCGKNISRVLLLGMIGAAACYLVAGLSQNVVVSMLACVSTGFCTSMLWPGTLIMMEENYPNPGVKAYALMAAGGDFGGSIAPQMLGMVVDNVSASGWAGRLGAMLCLTSEQIGMKVGMLTASIFPILGIFVLIYIRKYFSNRKLGCNK